MPSPNCHLSGVKDVVQEALTGTVANGKLPVAQICENTESWLVGRTNVGLNQTSE